MGKENGAARAMDEGEVDGEFDAAEPEMGLIRANIDVLVDAGMTEIGEDERGKRLRPNQCDAAALVAMGLNDEEVGDIVGVTRQTVNVWKNHNVLFMDEVRARRAEIWDSYKVDFRLLVPRAMEALGRGLDSRDERVRMEAARFVLRTLSLE